MLLAVCLFGNCQKFALQLVKTCSIQVISMTKGNHLIYLIWKLLILYVLFYFCVIVLAIGIFGKGLFFFKFSAKIAQATLDKRLFTTRLIQKV